MSLKMLTIALLLGSSAAFAGQLAEVPKDMQDIWCGPRLRVGGVPEGNCIRLGPKSISVEGQACKLLRIKEGPRNVFEVTYLCEDLVFETLLIKRRDYLIGRERDGAHWGESVRYERGNPWQDM
jgi:hypothetical protein